MLTHIKWDVYSLRKIKGTFNFRIANDVGFKGLTRIIHIDRIKLDKNMDEIGSKIIYHDDGFDYSQGTIISD